VNYANQMVINSSNEYAEWELLLAAGVATARVKFDVIEDQREREKREKERKARVVAWLRRSRW